MIEALKPPRLKGGTVESIGTTSIGCGPAGCTVVLGLANALYLSRNVPESVSNRTLKVLKFRNFGDSWNVLRQHQRLLLFLVGLMAFSSKASDFPTSDQRPTVSTVIISMKTSFRFRL